MLKTYSKVKVQKGLGEITKENKTFFGENWGPPGWFGSAPYLWTRFHPHVEQACGQGSILVPGKNTWSIISQQGLSIRVGVGAVVHTHAGGGGKWPRGFRSTHLLPPSVPPFNISPSVSCINCSAPASLFLGTISSPVSFFISSPRWPDTSLLSVVHWR